MILGNKALSNNFGLKFTNNSSRSGGNSSNGGESSLTGSVIIEMGVCYESGSSSN